MISRAFILSLCICLLSSVGHVLAQTEALDEPTFADVQTGCLNGEPKFCYELGLMLDFGEGMEEDNEKAMLLYLQACDADHAPACLEIASKHHLGDEADYKPEYTQALYEKACDLENAGGCYLWGNMVLDGEVSGQPDAAKAAELYSKACTFELAYACYESALTLLNDGDLEPNAKTPEAQLIYGLFVKGCDLGDGDSCHSLSGAYSVGYGTVVDLEQAAKFAAEAIELWTIACEEGDDVACEFLKE